MLKHRKNLISAGPIANEGSIQCEYHASVEGSGSVSVFPSLTSLLYARLSGVSPVAISACGSAPTFQVLTGTFAATVEVLVGRAVLTTLLLLVDPVC